MKGDGATALDIVIAGLSITSSWGNGHATTYRALVKGLAARGHRVTFLERDCPWYREHRDVDDFPYCETHLYQSLNELSRCFERRIATADLVILGSYVPDGVAVAGWVTTTPAASPPSMTSTHRLRWRRLRPVPTVTSRRR